MNGKLPDFKLIAARIDGTSPDYLEQEVRKVFAEGMRYATERIKTDEDLDFSCWIHEEADMVEKGKS